MNNIALTTDFSHQARVAYAAAASLARAHGATVHLVHEAAGFAREAGRPELAGWEARLQQALANEARSPALAGVAVKTHLLGSGNKHHSVVEFASSGEVDWIVVATHGHTGVGHALLGSFAEKLARSATIPVLTFRPRPGVEGFAPRSVLMPFDFSDNAAAAFPVARDLHERFDSDLRVMEVLHLDARLADHFGQQSRLYDDLRVAMLQAPDRVRRQLTKRCATELPNARVEVDVVEGRPASEIVKQAKAHDIDLIVLATHGRSGVQRLVLGSVAERVLRTAPCSVLTIRPGVETQKKE